MVEAAGFEPATPCVQSRCSSQLSYAPTWEQCNKVGGHTSYAMINESG
jgi:hypothetical protein